MESKQDQPPKEEEVKEPSQKLSLSRKETKRYFLFAGISYVPVLLLAKWLELGAAGTFFLSMLVGSIIMVLIKE